jgi:hypothetical protein
MKPFALLLFCHSGEAHRVILGFLCVPVIQLSLLSSMQGQRSLHAICLAQVFSSGANVGGKLSHVILALVELFSCVWQEECFPRTSFATCFVSF